MCLCNITSGIRAIWKRRPCVWYWCAEDEISGVAWVCWRVAVIVKSVGEVSVHRSDLTLRVVSLTTGLWRKPVKKEDPLLEVKTKHMKRIVYGGEDRWDPSLEENHCLLLVAGLERMDCSDLLIAAGLERTNCSDLLIGGFAEHEIPLLGVKRIRVWG